MFELTRVNCKYIIFSPIYFFDFNATRMLSSIERNSSNHIIKAGVMHADWFIQSSVKVSIWATSCENASLGICGQGRSRSACASAQSDQGLHCPLAFTGHYRMYQMRANARMGLRMRGMTLNLFILRMFEDPFSLGVDLLV